MASILLQLLTSALAPLINMYNAWKLKHDINQSIKERREEIKRVDQTTKQIDKEVHSDSAVDDLNKRFGWNESK